MTAVPDIARQVFGPRLPLAVRYVELLATDGVQRGLLGPREADRLWDRHLLNCAVVAELLPIGARVIDLGSGAGLPGIPLVLARADLQVTLVEPQARRVTFLIEATRRLELEVDVCRARAEELVGSLSAPVVTARAVAPLDRLAALALPLLERPGRLLAIRGASAGREIGEHAGAIKEMGGIRVRLRRCGVGLVEPPTTVVEVVRGRGRSGQ